MVERIGDSEHSHFAKTGSIVLALWAGFGQSSSSSGYRKPEESSRLFCHMSNHSRPEPAPPSSAQKKEHSKRSERACERDAAGSLFWKVMLAAGTVLTVWLLAGSSVPLGVPGEWVWPRLARPEGFWSAVDRLVPSIGAVVLLFGTALYVDRRVDHSTVWFRWLLLVILWGLSFVWQTAVRQSAPSPHRELRPLWVLYDRYATGYFWQARQIPSPVQWLSEYSAKMKQGDVLHEGTHPPGLVLWNLWAVRVTKGSPTITKGVLSTVSEDQARMFREMETQARYGAVLSEGELAALQLTVIMSLAFSALLPVVVFVLLSPFAGSPTAWRCAIVAITIPTITVFSPRSDVLYATSGLILLALIVGSVLASQQFVRILLAAACGVWLFGCLFFSLAHIPVIVAGLLFLIIHVFAGSSERSIRIRRIAVSATIAALVFGALVFMFWRSTSCNLLEVWVQNLRNHEAFYDQSPRTWWKWLLVNPLELTLATGIGLASFALRGVWDGLRSHLKTSESPAVAPVVAQMTLALFATWLLLWLSGKNMGEAARLWCFMTPWAAIGLASISSAFSIRDRSAWLWLMSTQCVVAIITTGLVSGYLQLAIDQ